MTARFGAALPVLAIVVLVAGVGVIVWSAGSTLGFDYLAYESAARRLLDGQPLYDTTIKSAGVGGLFLYPPPFALAIAPLALIGGQAAVWVWTGVLLAAFGAGVALLPVGRIVRWAIVLLAGLDWPFLYSIKLGQVGPILFLLFAIGWRALDRPGHPSGPRDRLVVGGSIGLGTLVKLQPGLLIGFATLTGRWRVAAVAVGVIVAGALAATIVGGTQQWRDYPAVLRGVAEPFTTLNNFSPGAVAWQAGASIDIAGAIQGAATLGALVAVVVAARAATSEAAFLVAVVASQLFSAVLWDHYALLLLLPVAWLLEHRQWWAAALPLATSIAAVAFGLPAIVYPIEFAMCLVAPIVVGWDRPRRAGAFDGVAA